MNFFSFPDYRKKSYVSLFIENSSLSIEQTLEELIQKLTQNKAMFVIYSSVVRIVEIQFIHQVGDRKWL